MNQETTKPGTQKNQTGFTKFCTIAEPARDILSSNRVDSVKSVRILFSWVPGFLISVSVCLVAVYTAAAGDAVAIGYNENGVWTGITYYASSKPKGGKDYETENGAREEAMRDLRKRSAYAATTVNILSSSDLTGFAAVARGKDKSGKDVNVVGRGKSQIEADKKALSELSEAGAGADQKIVYRYFSHGSDSK